MRITRLAPSPTGALHLGNARTFLINHLLARRDGWRTILRIEDIDGPRIKPHADRQAIEDLRWLGITWDEGPVYQSQRLALYQDALRRLIDAGAAYPCICSRSEVQRAASAPHAEDAQPVYPGICRGRFGSVAEAAATGRQPAIRFAVPPEEVDFDDEFLGRCTFDVARELGDFVIAKADGTPAYQLAVVVDDADMGVSDVVRGDDLVDSTPRQILLYGALGLEQHIPHYWHLPLVVGPDGRRLAKRHGDTRLSHYRQRGISADRILRLLAGWCGVEAERDEPPLAALEARFSISRLPRQPIVFDPRELES